MTLLHSLALISAEACFDSLPKRITVALSTVHGKAIKETHSAHSAVISFPLGEFRLWQGVILAALQCFNFNVIIV
jgi:hypothetical protein